MSASRVLVAQLVKRVAREALVMGSSPTKDKVFHVFTDMVVIPERDH